MHQDQQTRSPQQLLGAKRAAGGGRSEFEALGRQAEVVVRAASNAGQETVTQRAFISSETSHLAFSSALQTKSSL